MTNEEIQIVNRLLEAIPPALAHAPMQYNILRDQHRYITGERRLLNIALVRLLKWGSIEISNGGYQIRKPRRRNAGL